MPEGHTLHRLAGEHTRLLAGARVRASSPQGRFAEGARRIDGQSFEAAEAWGKHLLHRYADGTLVHIHLGLYGTFTTLPASDAPPVGQVRMRLATRSRIIDLRGPTRCELIGPPELAALLDRLGPDPLRHDAQPDLAWERIARSRVPIGALLMDQAVLAGVGNVYRAEVLFRQRIAPHRPGRDLERHHWDALWNDLAALMPVGVREGRMITVDAEHDHGAPPYQPGRPRTYVYRRAGEPCRVCAATIKQEELRGRKLYWCPRCQR
ncbi:Fpg/Nei family DNA glycosylase [Lolliginicoccus suaedae]|uniref:Fpg/Nei family DNA glycosylase n=1 Tax=Lolliginicoccus suaedae TaxID=2605429 RepID=UPI0011EFB58E|nr:DNA-formamidopyrimidine glycosylase family protein [Lolliginicoccus suaedae]